MKVLFSLLILASASLVHAKESRPIKLGLGVAMESYSIDTKESNSTNEAQASFFSSQVVPSVGFFVSDKILVGAQYSQSLMGEFSVSGVGAYARYYFFGGAPKRLDLEDLEINMSSNYSLFAGATYKSLSIGSGDVDIRFSVIEANAGIEKFFSHDYYLFGAFNISRLSSSENRTGISMGLVGGIGYHY